MGLRGGLGEKTRFVGDSPDFPRTICQQPQATRLLEKVAEID
jgi:hypothetical protein